MFRNRSHQQRYQVLLQALRQEGLRGDVISYSSMVGAFEKTGNWEGCCLVLQTMRLAHLPCDATMQNSIINVFQERGQGRWRQAQLFLHHSGLANIRADVISFNGLIQAAQYHTHWATSQRLLGLLPKRTLTADVISYSSAIQSCGGLEWEQARSLLGEIETQQLRADGMVYSAAMSVLAEVGQWLMALQTLKKLEKGNVESDVVCFNTVLAAGDLPGMEARKMLKTLLAERLQPNIKTYNYMISIFLRAGDWQQSLTLLPEMLSNAVQPDGITRSFIAEACMEASDWVQAVESLDLVAESSQHDLDHLSLQVLPSLRKMSGTVPARLRA